MILAENSTRSLFRCSSSSFSTAGIVITAEQIEHVALAPSAGTFSGSRANSVMHDGHLADSEVIGGRSSPKKVVFTQWKITFPAFPYHAYLSEKYVGG